MAPSFENSRLMTLSFEKTSFVDKLARLISARSLDCSSICLLWTTDFCALGLVKGVYICLSTDENFKRK
ncbi:hypothetical protein ScPMuIL_018403 [Solemya velum]